MKFRLVEGICKLKGRGRISKRVIYMTQGMSRGIFELLRDLDKEYFDFQGVTNLKW